MSEAERLAEDLHRQFMNDDHNFDTMIEASIELRRLSAEIAALKAALGRPVRWVVESDLALPCCAAFDHPGIDYVPLYAIPKDKP